MSVEAVYDELQLLSAAHPGLDVIQFTTPAQGPLGPESVDIDTIDKVFTDIRAGKLNRPHSDGRTCSDCRPDVGETDLIEQRTAPIRHFGGNLLHEAGVDLMVPGSAQLVAVKAGVTLDSHLSQLTGRVLKAEGVSAARIHGDNHGKYQKAGCGANGLLLPVLRRLGLDVRFQEEVVDLSYAQLRRMGIGTVRKRDLRTMSERGAEQGADDDYVDGSTPESRVDAVTDASGAYDVRDGAHAEQVWGINTGTAALAVRSYARWRGIQIFVTTPGASACRRMDTMRNYGHDMDTVLERIVASVVLDTAIGTHARNEHLLAFMMHQSVDCKAA